MISDEPWGYIAISSFLLSALMAIVNSFILSVTIYKNKVFPIFRLLDMKNKIKNKYDNQLEEFL